MTSFFFVGHENEIRLCLFTAPRVANEGIRKFKRVSIIVHEKTELMSPPFFHFLYLSFSFFVFLACLLSFLFFFPFLFSCFLQPGAFSLSALHEAEHVTDIQLYPVDVRNIARLFPYMNTAFSKLVADAANRQLYQTTATRFLFIR